MWVRQGQPPHQVSRTERNNMAILTRHFRVRRPESRIKTYEIPGFVGDVKKYLNKRLIIIEQHGWAGWVDDAERDSTIAALELGRGDPSMTETVDTLRQGSYDNCYKVDVDCDPVGAKQTPTNLMAVEYKITWQQITAGTSPY